MKKLMLWIIAFAMMSGGALLAQDLTGTWQGTLQAGKALRTVIKISKADGNGNGLKGVLYSIDQPGPGIAIGTITLQGSTVKMSVPLINGSYDGKLTPDGATITGTFTQGPNPLPLNLTRATGETAWEIPAPPPPPKKMAADANPVFEVATIRPSKPDTPGKGIRVNGRQFFTINTTLSDLITFAYGIHPHQITGAPAWLDTEKYDLLAEPEGDGQPSDKQLKIMVQKLLADRFKLTFHRDKKELAVYAITVDKTGSKLTPSQGDPNGLPGLGFRGLGNLTVRNANMTDFANLMQSTVLDRPVVDQTGLSGRFDFAAQWTPDEFQFGGAGARGVLPTASGDAPPDIFTAFREQLGLKLESTKAQADVFVIDRVEKPTLN